MGLREEIQAIRDRTDIEPPQKRALIYDLVGNAVVTALASRVNQTLTRGQYTVTLGEAPRYDGRSIIFPDIRATKAGVPVPLDLPIHFTNPPLHVPDGAGGFREDVQQAIRDSLMDLIR